MKLTRRKIARIVAGAQDRFTGGDHIRKHRTIRVDAAAYRGVSEWCSNHGISVGTIVDFLIAEALESDPKELETPRSGELKISVTLSLGNRKFVSLKQVASPTVSSVVSALLAGFWQQILVDSGSARDVTNSLK